MTTATFNLVSAALAALAAVFWARSTLVAVPFIASTEQAIAAGTGISMHEMNTQLLPTRAAFAALAALVQAGSVLVR
jgi:hypothetical protein